MDPLTALGIAVSIIGWSIEFNQKIQQRKEIAGEIVTAANKLQDHLEEVIERLHLDRAKGYLKAFSSDLKDYMREHDECIDCHENEEKLKALSVKFENLTTDIKPILYELQLNAKTTDVTLLTNVFPVYSAVNALAIAVLTQRKIRFNYYLADIEILDLLNENLDTHHEIERILYSIEHPRGSVFVRITNSNHPQEMFFKELNQIRKITEQHRYSFLINLNGDFSFNVTDEQTAFGGIKFNRCSNYALKEVDGRHIIAVNNKNGTLTNPSIYKRINGLYSNVDISFNVTAKTQYNNRLVEIAITEMDYINKRLVNEKRQQFTLTNSWEKYSVSMVKQEDHTVLDFDVFWYDNEEADLLIRDTQIELGNREFKLPLPTLPLIHPLAWQTRCENMRLRFDLSNESITTQYIRANDRASTYSNPSVLQNINIWPNSIRKYKITFQALIKSENDIGRKANLVIWDMKGNYPGGSGPIAFESGRYEISSLWEKFSVEAEIVPSTNIRCEIYWFDNEETDILIKDAELIYSEI
ncbi:MULTISPECIES: hypothetical protein [unclassified Bacillus (in: firmicutes)]|uniref:hypothetical protein n=1 Tax=unclassified Bacillus (in: firmicutes) TaxID=185979 RepID=UPI0030105A29